MQNSFKRVEGMIQVRWEEDEGEVQPTGHGLSLEQLRALSWPKQPEATSETNCEEEACTLLTSFE